jgi:hypothetical protein
MDIGKTDAKLATVAVPNGPDAGFGSGVAPQSLRFVAVVISLGYVPSLQGFVPPGVHMHPGLLELSCAEV